MNRLNLFFFVPKFWKFSLVNWGATKQKLNSRLNARSTMTEILGVTLTDTTQSGKERWLLQPARKGARLVECTRRRHGHNRTRPGERGGHDERTWLHRDRSTFASSEISTSVGSFRATKTNLTKSRLAQSHSFVKYMVVPIPQSM